MKKTLLTIAVCLIVCLAAYSQETQKEWLRVFPSEAGGAKEVRDAGGNKHPSTGLGSNTWFSWGGAGNWKVFKVKKGKPVIIDALGDSGPGAVLGHVAFRLSESENAGWKEKFTFEGPSWSGLAPKGEPQTRLVYFVPDSGSFRIDCVKGGFYIKVYQASQTEKHSKELSSEEKEKAAKLIKKLGCDTWKEREQAQRELKKMGEKILGLLEKEKDSPDLEIRIRIKKLIKALAPPATGKAVTEKAMKKQAAELVEKLVKYIKDNSFNCGSEPVKSLAAIGPHAAEPLIKEFDSDSGHVRAAAIFALGRLKDSNGLDTILNALKSDKEEEVRCRAAGALANFDTDEVTKALKAASENDKSEKVCKQAADSLKEIESRKTDKKEDE
jgi:hypothetical protein